MLGPLKRLLGGRPVVLASASPRRRQVLENIGFPVEVVPSHFAEELDKTSFPESWQYAEQTAAGKAREVAARLKEREDWAVVVGADTIVVVDGVILEKPGSASSARDMLSRLSGRGHTVYTGLAVVWREGEYVCHEATEVTFATLSQEVISSYVATGEPLDKAGAYGIQGQGGTLVQGVHGDYFNVVGLPLHLLCSELTRLLQSGILHT